MRCKNCGWPNQPGETTCVKCHAPLEADNSGVGAYSQHGGSDARIHETVLEPMPVAEGFVNNQGGAVCTQCGFPLRPGSEKCPKCGAIVQPNAQPGISRRGTVLNNPVTTDAQPLHTPHKAKGQAMKTINPYLDGYEPVPAASLKPLKRNSERKELPSFEFEGSQAILKRSNLDPDNGTIASECQAEIVNEGGKWFIKDCSDAKTTFVRAGEKIEIKDGSMILLGDRLFEFTVR